MAATVSIRDTNQSTLTLDNSSNLIQQKDFDSANQSDNYNISREWSISAEVSAAMDNVQRMFTDFGFWNNDEFSFNDSTCVIYFFVFIRGPLNIGMTTVLQTRLPKQVWSIYNLMRTGGGSRWYELTDGEAARNAQQALAEVICYYMNNQAVEVYMASVTPPGINWKDPAYVDAAGFTGTYDTLFAASNFTFDTLGTATNPMTNNGIHLTTDAPAYLGSFFFLDGPFSIYNTIGGAFSSGMGNFVSNMYVPTLEISAIDGASTGQVARVDPVQSPFPYLFNYITPVRGNNVMVGYVPVPVTKQLGVASAVPPYNNITIADLLSRYSTLNGALGGGSMALFSRATTLINSKYYMISCGELFERAVVSDSGNVELPAEFLAMIHGELDKRNQWHETKANILQSVTRFQGSGKQVNYLFRNDSGDDLVCQERNLPEGPIPAFTQGQLAHLPYDVWSWYYFDGIHRAGFFPMIPSQARLPPDTFIASFQASQAIS